MAGVCSGCRCPAEALPGTPWTPQERIGSGCIGFTYAGPFLSVWRLPFAGGVEPGERFGQRDGQVHLLPVRLGEQLPEAAAQYRSGLWVGGDDPCRCGSRNRVGCLRCGGRCARAGRGCRIGCRCGWRRCFWCVCYGRRCRGCRSCPYRGAVPFVAAGAAFDGMLRIPHLYQLLCLFDRHRCSVKSVLCAPVAACGFRAGAVRWSSGAAG